MTGPLKETVNFAWILRISSGAELSYTAHEEKLFCVQIYANKSRKQSTFAGNSTLLPLS